MDKKPKTICIDGYNFRTKDLKLYKDCGYIPANKDTTWSVEIFVDGVNYIIRNITKNQSQHEALLLELKSILEE